MRESLENLKRLDRWAASGRDLLIWFMFGIVLTKAISMLSPGYPIVVGTPSIPVGVYWVTKGAVIDRGDLVSFSFQPQEEWLKRYGDNLTHTKVALGLPGDIVTADSSGNLEVCSRLGSSSSSAWGCVAAGRAQDKDRMGRDLKAWLAPGESYTLKEGELWIHAPHPRSLDSRYHGPTQVDQVFGTASALWIAD